MLIVTAAVLIENDLIFIAQRKCGKHMAGFWEFPGGKIEAGETPGECLVREMHEEFNIDVKVREFFGESVYYYDHGPIKLLAFLVDWTGGTMTPSDHQDCRWVSFEDLKKYEFVPADRPFVEQLGSLKKPSVRRSGRS